MWRPTLCLPPKIKAWSSRLLTVEICTVWLSLRYLSSFPSMFFVVFVIIRFFYACLLLIIKGSPNQHFFIPHTHTRAVWVCVRGRWQVLPYLRRASSMFIYNYIIHSGKGRTNALMTIKLRDGHQNGSWETMHTTWFSHYVSLYIIINNHTISIHHQWLLRERQLENMKCTCEY